MKKDIKIALSLLLLLGTLGCNHPEAADLSNLSESGYRQFVENPENHLRTTIKSGVWDYTFQYRPAPYIALIEAGGESTASDSLIKRVESLKHTMWFNVAVSAKNKTADPLKYELEGLEEYNSRLSYFLELASKNFRLAYGTEKNIAPIGYYFENNYSIKPEVVMIVGFQIPDSVPKEKIVLEYYDGLFNAGILKFSVDPSALRNIPVPAGLKAQKHV